MTPQWNSKNKNKEQRTQKHRITWLHPIHLLSKQLHSNKDIMRSRQARKENSSTSYQSSKQFLHHCEDQCNESHCVLEDFFSGTVTNTTYTSITLEFVTSLLWRSKNLRFLSFSVFIAIHCQHASSTIEWAELELFLASRTHWTYSFPEIPHTLY